ncbi:MAG: hypothetical protein JO167_00715, partial [Alphaproteobacteria bacterium]|nr:hypothetical protein [Alphaproteobacteria bacterium]
NYTLRGLLAGTHDAPRDFTVRTNGGAIRAIDLPPFQQPPARTPLTIRRLDDILCLRIENSLGDRNLIPTIDAALDAPGDARALILDLRNTPSGGTTDIAEPILGRFITGRPNYQRVFKPAPGMRFPQDSTLRWVRSRGRTITLPMAILVDRWTGSMGEGMAIGFDGLKRATVVGTRMAGLCGATQMFTLPASGIGVRMPVERLYHLDNTPREFWVPPALVDLGHETGADPILRRAVEILRG